MTDEEKLKSYKDRARAIMFVLRASLGNARKLDKKVSDDEWENSLLIALTSLLAGHGHRLGLSPDQNAENLRHMSAAIETMEKPGQS